MTDMSFIFHPQNYYFNPFAIGPAISAVLVLMLGFFVYSLDPRGNFHRAIFQLSLSAGVWLIGYVFLFSSHDRTAALFWIYVLYLGLIFIPPSLLNVSLSYSHRLKQEKNFLILAYGVAGFLILVDRDQLLLRNFREYSWGLYPDAGLLQAALILFITTCFTLSIFNLRDYYLALTNSLEKRRTKSLILGVVFLSLIAFDLLNSFGIPIYPAGYLAVIGFVISILYSVINHHYLTLDRYTRNLEQEVQEKTKEISKVVEELKSTQLRLLETGKISAIASLSAGILHQLSQPITAIQGFVKYMRKELKEEDAFFRPVKLMDEQIDYIKQMLENLMELVRHREIKKEKININIYLKKSMELLTDELRIRRISWEVVYGDHLPVVYADGIHFQQVFMNICVNAIQALGTLPKGAPRIFKVVSSYNEQSQNVVITFCDNGPGLAEKDKGFIFEPFFSTKTKGSGIGLALCKDLVSEHGGTIAVESQPDQGATFTITLPAAHTLKLPDPFGL